MLSSDAAAMARRIEIIRAHQDAVRRALSRTVARDALLTPPTPSEMAASATSRADLGMVYNGLDVAFAREGLDPATRARAMDAVGAIVAKYLGVGTGWPVSANGTAYTGVHPNEQGTEGTADAALRHLDCQHDMSARNRMQRANEAAYPRPGRR